MQLWQLPQWKNEIKMIKRMRKKYIVLGCSLDYVSRRINGPGCSTYEIREKYYTSTLQKYDIVMD